MGVLGLSAFGSVATLLSARSLHQRMQRDLG